MWEEKKEGSVREMYRDGGGGGRRGVNATWVSARCVCVGVGVGLHTGGRDESHHVDPLLYCVCVCAQACAPYSEMVAD